MDHTNRTKEFFLFFGTLVIIGATFAGAILAAPAPTPRQEPTPAVATTVAVAPSSTVAIITPTTTPITTPTTTPTKPVAKILPQPQKATTTPVATPAVAAIATSSTSSPPSQPAPKPKPLSLPLPYSIGTFNTAFAAGDGWNIWWGGNSETGGALIIGASSTGGGVLLAGSSAWTDYTFTATLDWLKGQSFNLIARYADNKNYVDCNFQEQTAGDLHLTVEQYQNGKTLTLANGDLKNYNQLGGTNITAAIQVDGDAATCAFNNHTISTMLAGDTLMNPPLRGEIGITAWDPTVDNSEIVVKNVGVSSAIYDLGPNVESE